MYNTYLNPIFKDNKLEQHCVTFLAKGSFPTISSHIDSKLFLYNKYVKNLIHLINDCVNTKLASLVKSKPKGKTDNKENKKEDKKEEKPEEKKEKSKPEPYTGVIKIYYAAHFTPEQHRVYEILQQAEYNDANQCTTDVKSIIRKEMATSDEKLRTLTLQFAAFIAKDVEQYGKEVLVNEIPFDEVQALKDNMTLINKLTRTTNIEIVEYSETNKPKGAKSIAVPGKPLISSE